MARASAIVSFLVAVFAAAAMSNGAAAAPAQELEKVTVLLDWPYPVAEHAAVQLAAVKGWYADDGLDVTIEMGRGGSITVQQIAAGQADIGYASLSAAAVAISRNMPIISVMCVIRNGDLALSIASDTGAKTLQDIKGRKIAVPSGGTVISLVDAYFQSIGMAKSDVNLVQVDPNALYGLFLSDSVDGLVSQNSNFARNVGDRRPAQVFFFSDAGLLLPQHGFMVRTDALDGKKAAALRKIVQINEKAWAYILAGHEQEAIDAVVARGADSKPEAQGLMRGLRSLMPRIATPATKGKPIGWQATADWETYLKNMERAGLVEPGWKTGQYFDNRWITAN